MSLFKTSRKVQMFGDSLALTIPSMFVKVCEIEKGNKIRIFYDLEGTLILTKSGNEEELKISLTKFLAKIEKNISTLDMDKK
jgi:antitoxin component of MazEF toxin-antitoxin module